MAIANQVQATVIYCTEGGTFGVAPAAGSASAKTLRRVSSSLAPNKDTYQSGEARPDLQLADFRHGTKRPGGGLETELANVAFDDFIEALLRGTWANGTTALAATYTTIAAAITSGAAGAPGSIGTLTWTAADPIAAGFRLGDICRLVGAGFAPNNAVNFRIVGFGGTSNRTISVTPAPAVVAATAGTSMIVQGKKLLTGTVSRSFTLEQSFPDIDYTELYTGMRLGSGAFRLPPNGMATASFGFMGQDQSVLDAANAPYFTSPAAAGTNGIFSGPAGSLRVGGIEQGIITGLDINVDLGLDAPAVVGRTTVPDIFYGPTRITGNVSAFLQDKTLTNQFINESEIDLVAYLAAAMVAPEDFLCFNMQRVKLGGATKTVGGSSGVIATFPFTALLASSTQTVLGADASTLVVQRSN
jgi:hypothetical protein